MVAEAKVEDEEGSGAGNLDLVVDKTTCLNIELRTSCSPEPSEPDLRE